MPDRLRIIFKIEILVKFLNSQHNFKVDLTWWINNYIVDLFVLTGSQPAE